MKAIVLTYDKYSKISEHMVIKYDQVWPDHPFTFLVPYQNQKHGISSDKVEYRKTSKSIKSTVLELLEGLDDEQFVYWCMDDKYPVEIDISKANEIYQWVNSNKCKVDGVLFCRCRSMWNRNYLLGKSEKLIMDIKFFPRNSYKQIWLHQFLKVKVIRYLFRSFPDEMPNAKIMDELKDCMDKPGDHRIYVTQKNYAVFGESTSRGAMTLNCYDSFLENGLVSPDWVTGNTGKRKMFGIASDNLSRRFRYLFKQYNKLKKP